VCEKAQSQDVLLDKSQGLDYCCSSLHVQVKLD